MSKAIDADVDYFLCEITSYALTGGTQYTLRVIERPGEKIYNESVDGYQNKEVLWERKFI